MEEQTKNGQREIKGERDERKRDRETFKKYLQGHPISEEQGTAWFRKKNNTLL